MDITPFFVQFVHDSELILAEIKPCCQQDDVFYYDVSVNDQFLFTITPDSTDVENRAWKIVLKNADKQEDPKMVRIIGEQIDLHFIVL